MAVSPLHMAARPAAGITRGYVYFSLAMLAIFWEKKDLGLHLRFHPPCFSLRRLTSIQKRPMNNNYQDIATVSAIFTQHSTSLHDARSRTFTLMYENDDSDHSCRVEHAAPRHARITLRVLLSEPLQRRACCCAARPHHFLQELRL